MPSQRDVDLAWAAGLFEGEGCISVADFAPRLKLRVVSTDRDVVEKLNVILGYGYVHLANKAREPHHKDAWAWTTARREHVVEILGWLMPHFGDRRYAKAMEALQSYIGMAA